MEKSFYKPSFQVGMDLSVVEKQDRDESTLKTTLLQYNGGKDKQVYPVSALYLLYIQICCIYKYIQISTIVVVR